jgi:hypothetical protein
MDELDQLRALRAGLPPIRPERRSAARGALLGRARAEAPGRGTHPLSAPRRRRLGFVLLGGPVAALAVALVILLAGGRAEVETAAARTLKRFATAAAAEAPLGPGEYQLTRSKSGSLDTFVEGRTSWSVFVPHEEERWRALDGSGRLRSRTGRPRFLSAGQRRAWLAAGRPDLIPARGEVSDEVLGTLGGRYLDLSALPREPARLRALIEARKIRGLKAPPGEAQTFALLGEMLIETYISPALRAAIYEVAAELPGVELREDVRDPLGRRALAVAYLDLANHRREELLFDPTDAGFLGERQVATEGDRDGYPAGTTIAYTALLESHLVDSLSSRRGGSPPLAHGIHQVGLRGASIEGIRLSPVSMTRVRLPKRSREIPEVKITFANEGRSAEAMVSAMASVDGRRLPGISSYGPPLAPGRRAQVAVGLEPIPHGPTRLEIELEKVPGQVDAPRNQALYEVDFE